MSIVDTQCGNCNSAKEYLTSFTGYCCRRCDKVCPKCGKPFEVWKASENDKFSVHVAEESLRVMIEYNIALNEHLNYHKTHHTEVQS